MTLALTNLGRICTFDDQDRVLTGAALLLDPTGVRWIGPQADLPPPAEGEVRELLDCGGRAALPGLVDSHTHTVFAGDRREEFALRSAGATYAEIHAAGGGIRRTMTLTRAADEATLLDQAAARALAMLRRGVTTIEVKSGYGLDLETELRMLRVARAIEQRVPVRVFTTFLGAHTVPPEYAGRRGDYVDFVCDAVLPRVAEERLADVCDVFCEAGAFTLDESRRVLEAGRRFGLLPKLHAD